MNASLASSDDLALPLDLSDISSQGLANLQETAFSIDFVVSDGLNGGCQYLLGKTTEEEQQE